MQVKALFNSLMPIPKMRKPVFRQSGANSPFPPLIGATDKRLSTFQQVNRNYSDFPRKPIDQVGATTYNYHRYMN